MIPNRIRLTPTLRAKRDAQAQSVARADEKLFLTNLRLSELALLVPLKLLAIKLIRQHIAVHGATPRLESELAEQREQLQDLSQLSRDWLKSISAAKNQPSSSEPLDALLAKLGVDFNTSLTASEK